MQPISYERRAARRYPVALKVSCKRIAHGLSLYAGSGTTLNMSSTGILLDLDQSLTPGDYVELLIRWPAGRQTMQVLGRVVRSEPAYTAVEILHHKFASKPLPRAARIPRRATSEGGTSARAGV
jgi:hypothetical protein